MARTSGSRTRTQHAALPDPERRSLLVLGLPALGALGVATALPQRPKAATARSPGTTPAAPDDAGTLTPHREAYYRRARF